jgi:hypothetical protein
VTNHVGNAEAGGETLLSKMLLDGDLLGGHKRTTPCGHKRTALCGHKRTALCGHKRTALCGRRRKTLCGHKRITLCGRERITLCGRKRITLCGRKRIALCRQKRRTLCRQERRILCRQKRRILGRQKRRILCGPGLEMQTGMTGRLQEGCLQLEDQNLRNRWDTEVKRETLVNGNCGEDQFGEAGSETLMSRTCPQARVGEAERETLVNDKCHEDQFGYQIGHRHGERMSRCGAGGTHWK